MLTQSLYSIIGNNFIDNEQLCTNYSTLYDNAKSMYEDGCTTFELLSSNDVKDRANQEQYYYEYILNGLHHHVLEVKHYSQINIFDSRRIVFTNNDCISFVQLLVRDKIYLSVHMRSSHYTDALLSDLRFFTSIPYNFIKFITENNIIDDLQQFSINDMKISFNITFGSLHR
jgi:hypothetical protein